MTQVAKYVSSRQNVSIPSICILLLPLFKLLKNDNFSTSNAYNILFFVLASSHFSILSTFVKMLSFISLSFNEPVFVVLFKIFLCFFFVFLTILPTSTHFCNCNQNHSHYIIIASMIVDLKRFWNKNEIKFI